MSKRIMCEVFCTAEDLGMDIFYSDTDSMHLYNEDIPRLAEDLRNVMEEFSLVKTLVNFIATLQKSQKDKQSLAYKSIFCGKKTYIDLPTNDLNEVAFHCRMKGVKQDVIALTANEMFPDSVQCFYDEDKGLMVPQGKFDKDSEFSVMKLYKALYDGQEIAFDLCKSATPAFEEKFNFSIQTKTSFIRKLKF
ncbi:organellar and viral DNA polymerase type B [Trichomonas vaginalis G3]|uniref:organellar and viral DNA polymerase type B n=1 Tax=Trichomonas vaginalis (strain ATCC PRA-98 / G3) TaxID=412133 RepID=UPI0021E56A42|nr:organellar and viral DNA polymerase type B [Trichomonas vaginalis G3]KAI5513337.1 organellar and viral DNA polymerase type B [Trichomonas vaginalis G3]